MVFRPNLSGSGQSQAGSTATAANTEAIARDWFAILYVERMWRKY